MNGVVLSRNKKVLVARGADPSCGLGDDVYSVPIDCGERKPTMKPCSPESGPCLYDIIADPCEYHDVASENPQVVQRLQQRLEDYQKGVVKPSNVPLDPEAFPSHHGGAWVTWKDDVPL
ncbi:hypothetical protein V5799_028046 [Amblyomma americanum]|uniref:Uncharacterized protein n=1 Tax=Amblyomma americanum TaxID=6943 RepID=A0AAQ4DDZ7_AMBAM